MRRLLSVITIVLLAVPAYAQDDFGGGFGGDTVLSAGDIDALFGGGGNRGGTCQRVTVPGRPATTAWCAGVAPACGSACSRRSKDRRTRPASWTGR